MLENRVLVHLAVWLPVSVTAPFMSLSFSVQAIANDRHQEKPVIPCNVWCMRQNWNVCSRVSSVICFAGVSSVP